MARNFALTSDKISIASVAALQDLPLGSFSAGAVLSRLSDKGNQTLMFKGSTIGTDGWWFALEAPTSGGNPTGNYKGAVRFYAKFGTTTISIASAALVSALSAWAYVGFTFNGGTKTVTLYGTSLTGTVTALTFNTAAGLNVATGSGTYASDGTNPLLIGMSSGSVENFVGNLRRMRIWNTARTAAEHQAYRDGLLMDTATVFDAVFSRGVGTYAADVYQDGSENTSAYTPTLAGTTQVDDPEIVHKVTSTDFWKTITPIRETLPASYATLHAGLSKYWRPSQFAEFVADVPGDSIDITQLSTLDTGYQGNATMAVYVDGVFSQLVTQGTGTPGTFGSGTTNQFNSVVRNTVALGGGSTTKRVTIRCGAQSHGPTWSQATPIQATVPVAIRAWNGATPAAISVVAEVTTGLRTVYVVQDSISSFYAQNTTGTSNNTGSGSQLGIWQKFSGLTGIRVITDAWGGHSVMQLTCSTSVASATFDQAKIDAKVAQIVAANPDEVVIWLSANDTAYAGGAWTSSGTYGAASPMYLAYLQFVNTLRASALPSTTKITLIKATVFTTAGLVAARTGLRALVDRVITNATGSNIRALDGELAYGAAFVSTSTPYGAANSINCSDGTHAGDDAYTSGATWLSTVILPTVISVIPNAPTGSNNILLQFNPWHRRHGRRRT